MSAPSAFSSLVSSYGTLYKPWGVAANETVGYTLRTATAPVEYENQRRFTANGSIKLDGFLVSLLLGMSSLDFEMDYITDGYDEEGNMICSSYVSREVFELLVDAVKSKGYTLADFDNVQYDEDEDEDYDDEE